jgi:hypothetical protein
MEKELRGWGVVRENPITTSTGLILYFNRKEKQWSLKFPDDANFFGMKPGDVTALIALLGEGKSLSQARKQLGWKTTIH